MRVVHVNTLLANVQFSFEYLCLNSFKIFQDIMLFSEYGRKGITSTLCGYYRSTVKKKLITSS